MTLLLGCLHSPLFSNLDESVLSQVMFAKAFLFGNENDIFFTFPKGSRSNETSLDRKPIKLCNNANYSVNRQ